jgi:hypothetical protein
VLVEYPGAGSGIDTGPRLGSERYGDLMSAPTLMVGATLPGSDRDVWMPVIKYKINLFCWN